MMLTNPSTDYQPLTQKAVKKRYEKRERFSQYLSVSEYLPESGFFMLEDGFSLGVAFEVDPVACEGRTAEFLLGLHGGLKGALHDGIPEEDEPWILQWYTHYEAGVTYVAQGVVDYMKHLKTKPTPYSRFYLKEVLYPHLQRLSQPKGIFHDELVTNNNFKGQRLRVRICLYRRYSKESRHRKKINPADELKRVSENFKSHLEGVGVELKKMHFKQFYEWQVKWFNPKPSIHGESPESLLKLIDTPDDELPFGEDLSDSFFFSAPRCEVDSGTIWFDELPHSVITVQALKQNASPGILTAEIQQQDHLNALIDNLPDGSIISGTVTFTPQDEIEKHLENIKSHSRGGTAKTDLSTNATDYALAELARGEKLFPLQMVIYLKGHDLADLEKRKRDCHAILNRRGFKTILSESDLIPINTYINNLPLNYRPEYDKIEKRSRLQFTNNIASLMPMYSRSTGSGYPGSLAFNRAGEPFTFDVINERKNNAFLIMLAPPGAGKSAKLADMILFIRAMMDVRIIFIEKGNSQGLTCDLFESKGFSVNRLILNKGSGVRLPPFINAYKFVKESRQSLDEEQKKDRRDYLGEMVTVAHLMYSGGLEEERLTRSELGLLQRAIVAKATEFYDLNKQVLTQDIIDSLRALATDEPKEKEIAHKIASGLELFTEGMAGEFFNQEGEAWQDADVLHVEMGQFADKGNLDKLAVAYIGIMNSIADIAERSQYRDKHTIILTDEGHIILKEPLLADYFVSYNKMARKLGLWPWIATQNIEDFKGNATKILSMAEWWITLSTTKSQIDQIAQIKELTDEQKSLMLSATKCPGKYTEGVVISDSVNGLFRNVPPPLALALAMTEKNEKAARQKLMDKHNCTELDAAFMIAKQIEAGQWNFKKQEKGMFV